MTHTSRTPKYMRRYAKLYSTGVRMSVPVAPYERKVQALRAIGHSTAVIAAGSGVSRSLVEHIAAGRKVRVSHPVARALDDYYALNHMNPLDDTPARRAKTHAKRLGFLPPLAWDNIERGY